MAEVIRRGSLLWLVVGALLVGVVLGALLANRTVITDQAGQPLGVSAVTVEAVPVSTPTPIPTPAPGGDAVVAPPEPVVVELGDDNGGDGSDDDDSDDDGSDDDGSGGDDGSDDD